MKALSLALLLMVPSSSAAQSGVVLTGAPTGTTNVTNPVIHVTAPGAVSYKYSINGAPYSDELPVWMPIEMRANVRFGDRAFLAGTGDLSAFINLRTNGDSYAPFLDNVTLDDVRSQVQLTYVVNKLRAVVGPENVLNLSGTGVEALAVTLEEGVPAGVRYELSALAVTGGELSRKTSPDSTRRFLLSLARSSDSLTLTPTANNGLTTIAVNGQTMASGTSIIVSHPIDGSSISLQTVGADGSLASYTIAVTYDDSLDRPVYRSYYLRAFDPPTAYVSLRNSGASVVAYAMTFNDTFGRSKQGILREIETMEPEYPEEPMPRKVWRFIRDNSYLFDPISEAGWFSSVALFLNSAGFGYCDDTAGLFQELLTSLGYTVRVWGLNGHVVPEVFVDNRWEAWDPALGVYYRNRDGLVAGVEELARDRTLITLPIDPILPLDAWAYQGTVADIYSSGGDNFIYPAAQIVELPATLEIPPGGAFEFPILLEAPLVTQFLTSVPSYTNARLVVPPGFAGTLSVPLIIQSIGWSNNPRLFVLTRNAAGTWDSQPAEASWVVDCVPPITTPTQPSGSYNPDELVTLVANEPATIYYTTDGSTPTEASSVYMAPVALVAGGSAKFFAVDRAGNHEMVRGYGPAASHVDLQISSMGSTTASFSASATGGTGIYEFKYLLRDAHSVWSVVQFYGAANTWLWDKTGAPTGSYTVQVWVRNTRTSVEYDAIAWVAFTVTDNRAPMLVNPGNQVSDDTAGYAQGVLADAPVAYWRLGELAGSTAADSAGSSPGTVVGGVTLGQAGALPDDPAMRFDGSTGYLRAPSPAASLAGDLTIEMWLNVSLATRQTLISKSYLHELELTLETSGVLNFYQGDGTTYAEASSGFAVIGANRWQHLVVTRTTATKTITFYVNGIAMRSRAYTTVVTASPAPVSIGRSDGGSQYVNGWLDEVALYPAALSPAQVGARYAFTNRDASIYARGVLADTPVAYWRLGERTGAIAADRAGTNPGTLVGGVTLGEAGALADSDSAMRLDGSTGYILVASPAASLAGDLTIEMWLNVSLATRQTLISKSYLHELELTLETSGVLNFYQGDGTTYAEASSGFAVIGANRWQHLVVTRAAATKTITFYVNGAATRSRAYTTAVTSSQRPVSIGRSDGGTQYVNGWLDEVALYPAALSAGQIAAHYARQMSADNLTAVALPLVATDPDGDGLTYAAAGLPSGLSVSAATGLISGTLSATSIGIHQVTVTVSDGNFSQSQAFTWTVGHLPTP